MSLKKNFIYNTIYQIFLMILPIITVPYVSRVLLADGIGKYSFTSANAYYFVLIGMVGIGLYGNRQVAYVKKDKNKLSQEFWNIYALQLITTITSLTIYFIFFVLINKVDTKLYFVQSLTIIATVFDISWFFIGYEDMKSVVLRNTLTKIIGVILVFTFVKTSNDVLIYALIIGSNTLIGQLIMWLGLKDKVYFVKPKLSYALTHLRPATGLFVSQIAIQVYTLLDRTMLGVITTNAQVGLYDNSQKLIKILVALATSLGTVMLPRMSALYAEGKMDEFKALINKAFSLVNFMSFPLVIGLISISDGFSYWFYGPDFSGIEVLLKLGSLIIVAISWSNILGIQIMLPMKKEKEFTLSVTVGAITNLILNFILISSFQAVGTTVASVISEIAVTITQFYFLRSIVNYKDVFRGIHKPIIASIIMYIVVRFTSMLLPIGIIYTMIEVCIGGVTYIVLMFIMKDKILTDVINEAIRKIRR